LHRIDKYFSTLEILLQDSIYSQYVISLKGSCITKCIYHNHSLAHVNTKIDIQFAKAVAIVSEQILLVTAVALYSKQRRPGRKISSSETSSKPSQVADCISKKK
jgi:hypothetical protein